MCPGNEILGSTYLDFDKATFYHFYLQAVNNQGFLGSGELRTLVHVVHFLAAICTPFFNRKCNFHLRNLKNLWPHGDAGYCFSVLIKFWLIFFSR